MKVHIRYDEGNAGHQPMTVFVNGENCGKLTLGHAEAQWLYLIIQEGCSKLSPKGASPIEFVGSGKPFDKSETLLPLP